MAIFNNGFPATYPQMYPQYQQPFQQPQGYQTPQNPQPQQNSGIIWIQGLQAAKSFLIAPNTTVPLFDTETQSIYLKSADSSGMPSLKILDYTIRDQNAGNISQNISGGGNVDSSSYVTKAEFDDLKMKFEAFCAKKPVKQQKKEEAIDE